MVGIQLHIGFNLLRQPNRAENQRRQHDNSSQRNQQQPAKTRISVANGLFQLVRRLQLDRIFPFFVHSSSIFLLNRLQAGEGVTRLPRLLGYTEMPLS